MKLHRGLGLVIAMIACGPSRPITSTPVAKPLSLAILPAESDVFPDAAAATTASLVKAHLTGAETQVSKVSLEVVQLSIECVDESLTCYVAAGRSLSANRLLFATFSGTKTALAVTINQIDVDTAAATKTATKTFASEAEATKGVAALVAEATSP